MLYKLIYNFIVFLTILIRPIAIVLDDFTSSGSYTIQNSDGTNVEVTRTVAPDNQTLLTLSNNNLNFNQEKPIEDRHTDISPHQLTYTFVPPLNISELSNLKYNMNYRTVFFCGLFDIYSNNNNNNNNMISFRHVFGIFSNTANLKGDPNDIITGNPATMDFTNISKISIFMNVDEDGEFNETLNFNMRSLEIVPEPFSVSTLGIGIVAFVRKRKQKN